MRGCRKSCVRSGKHNVSRNDGWRWMVKTTRKRATPSGGKRRDGVLVPSRGIHSLKFVDSATGTALPEEVRPRRNFCQGFSRCELLSSRKMLVPRLFSQFIRQRGKKFYRRTCKDPSFPRTPNFSPNSWYFHFSGYDKGVFEATCVLRVLFTNYNQIVL